ncbi:uncharacterized protein LOC125208297 [Salvia hispanica]|uniref:uncharacterized protein LOC125208297 n=1 Tax=Salvia hispanica TaxID=49212 RepID=UPI002009513D|nr:uncharacterized protein LOC125208297 [Salvia hispanica]
MVEASLHVTVETESLAPVESVSSLIFSNLPSKLIPLLPTQFIRFGCFSLDMAGFSPHKLFLFIRLYLLTFISAFIFRLQGDGSGALNKSDEKIEFVEAERLDFLKDKDEINGDESVNVDGGDAAEEGEEEEEENTVEHLKFKFPTFDEFSRLSKESGDALNSEVVPCATVNMYQFSSGKSFVSAFIDEAETFPVKEGEIDCSFEKTEASEAGNSEEDFDQTGCVHVDDRGKEIEVSDGEKIEEEGFSEKLQLVEECRLDSEKSSEVMDCDSESTSFDHLRSVMNHLVDSYSDGFLSDGDFGGGFDVDDAMDSESEVSGFEETDEFDDEDSDIMEELKKLEDDGSNVDGLKQDFDDSNVDGFEQDFDDSNVGNVVPTNGDDDDDEKFTSKDSSVLDSEDPSKLELLWEHQELIEQLKMELKKVKATGLPTILEDSESPKISDDLKPWRIDESQREDCIGELHKFYKSYRERMRKFDIINYQKMYAMGFLQLKDPLQSISKQKRAPTLKSLVSQNLWLSKHKIHGSDPMKKFVEELQGDLEAVYVGQMCLSWEFLHWQYEKAWDLWDTDPRGRRRYNEVANEFQQFQVLMNRFTEDELFQGPRVQNYVKTRCAVRNLLQVPVIREDNLKDKRRAEKRDMDEYIVTSDMLVEIVEESIRTFWRFVRADKDCSAAGTSKKTPELPSQEEHKLLVEIRKDLHKKERKLKEVLRSENCILRKIRRYREEDDSDQVLYFFSQVDMKLVSRVLNMSKVTREQLIWCNNKLGSISFVNRKLHVEPDFLLFPC